MQNIIIRQLMDGAHKSWVFDHEGFTIYLRSSEDTYGLTIEHDDHHIDVRVNHKGKLSVTYRD